jgi:hypothetical protein
LRQPIGGDKKIEMWENVLNHCCRDHSKCYHPAHQGYQWKNRYMLEDYAGLRPLLPEGSEIVQKIDPLTGSTEANELCHDVRGKYTNKYLNFTTCFAVVAT